MATIRTITVKRPICGRISEVYKKLQAQKDFKATIRINTPFGFVECNYSEIAKRWSVVTAKHRLYIPDNKQKGSIHSRMPLSGYSHKYVPWGVFRNPNYKFRKNRKSKAICPGLDLRPLQQEYRRKLGDMARFSMLLREMRAIGLNTLVQSSFDVSLAKLLLKRQYEYRKKEIIALHKRGVVTKYTTEAYKGDV